MTNWRKKLGKVFQQTKEVMGEWKDKVKDLKKKREGGVKETKKDKARRGEVMTVNLSAWSVAKSAVVVLLIILAAWFVYEVREIVYTFLLALFLAAAFSPFVDKMEEHRVPRWASIFLIYFLAFVLFVVVVLLTGVLVFEQIGDLVNTIIEAISGIVEWADDFGRKVIRGEINLPYREQVLPVITDAVKAIDPQDVRAELNQWFKDSLLSVDDTIGFFIDKVLVFFTGVVNLVMVLVLTFFMVLERTALNKFFYSLLPSKYSSYASRKAGLVQRKIGAWMWGQLTLCFVIGILTYIGLVILGVPYAPTLALIAGALEFVPYLGPLIAAVPAVLIGVNSGGWMWLWVILLYILIQQVENNVVVPLVMNRAVGLSPVVVIMALLIGAHFFGIPGIILSVPVATALKLFVTDYADMEK